MLQDLQNFFQVWTLSDLVVATVDIVIVGFLIYRVLLLIRGTRAVPILIGLVLVIIGFFLSFYFGFSALNKVRTIEVSVDDTQAVWFTAPGDEATIQTYAEELSMYGGENLFNQDGGSGGAMYGSWQFAGILNGAVWGIHAAPSREALLLHWETLKERVQ